MCREVLPLSHFAFVARALEVRPVIDRSIQAVSQQTEEEETEEFQPRNEIFSHMVRRGQNATYGPTRRDQADLMTLSYLPTWWIAEEQRREGMMREGMEIEQEGLELAREEWERVTGERWVDEIEEEGNDGDDEDEEEEGVRWPDSDREDDQYTTYLNPAQPPVEAEEDARLLADWNAPYQETLEETTRQTFRDTGHLRMMRARTDETERQWVSSDNDSHDVPDDRWLTDEEYPYENPEAFDRLWSPPPRAATPFPNAGIESSTDSAENMEVFEEVDPPAIDAELDEASDKDRAERERNAQDRIERMQNRLKELGMWPLEVVRGG